MTNEYAIYTANQRLVLTENFKEIFVRLLAGEHIDFYAPHTHLSQIFQFIATNLLASLPRRKLHWYDGVTGLTSHIRKSKQIEFIGEMWVGDEAKQWKEDFRARVTDKRMTQQGIEIVVWVGMDTAQAELKDAFCVEM